MPSQIKAFPRNYMYHFHVNPIGQLVVSELHLALREAGKRSLSQTAMRQLKMRRSITVEREDGYWEISHGLHHSHYG